MAFSYHKDLVAADILVYRSAGWIAKAIRFFDDTEASHASLFLGDGQVAEVLVEGGLQQCRLETSMADSDWIAVRRLAQNTTSSVVCTPIGVAQATECTVQRPAGMQPVLAKAAEYLAYGERFGYQPILLLAGICLLRPIDLRDPQVRYLVKAVIDKATAVVGRCREEGEQPLLSSEFVCRCYDEAVLGEDSPYALEIPPCVADGSCARRVGWQRRERLVLAAASIPRDCLLGHLQRKHGSLSAALESVRGVAAVSPPPQISDVVLDVLIETIIAQRSGDAAKPAGMPAELPSVILHDLRAAIYRLAVALHEATDGGQKLGPGAFAAPLGQGSLTPADTLLEFAADFVTPGDLLRSPSLTTIGEIEAQPMGAA